MKCTGVLTAVITMLLAGCIPRIEIAAPEEPVTINMNVNIEHQIHITADKNVEEWLKKSGDAAAGWSVVQQEGASSKP